MTETKAIQRVLEERFAATPVVFWHDPEEQFATHLDELTLDGVQIVRVEGDEFAVKHTILSSPDSRYLVFRSGAIPSGTDNWLLDLELAYGIFTADKTSILQEEMHTSNPAVASAVGAHERFFSVPAHRQGLEKLLDDHDDLTLVRAKMSQVLLGSAGHQLTDILRDLLVEHAAGRSTKFEVLAEHGLDSFFWDGCAQIYGYTSGTPTMDDFVIWIFQRAFEGFTADTPQRYRNIRADFNTLRHDMRTVETMKALAGRASAALDISSAIVGRPYREVLETTVFEEVDRHVIVGLAEDVRKRAITPRTVADVIQHRQHSLWHESYAPVYQAIQSAVNLIAAVDALPASIPSPAAGLESYQREWFRLDQHYRHFTFAVQTTEYRQPLQALKDDVDRLYTHRFLYEFGELWQRSLDTMAEWKVPEPPPQRRFYERHVAPLVKSGRTKAVVIVSDALRYEIADELASRIRNEDKFDADLSAMLGSLPSYTQLGMASLLPQKALTLTPDGERVLADDRRTDGVENRHKVLESVGGFAMNANQVLEMSRDDMRQLYAQHQVIYVFHDRIDKAGDEPQTERTVFQAAEETIRELVHLVKKWTSANATNILITADHGFLYQDTALDESYYLSEAPQGDAVTKLNRRFVLGHSLQPSSAFMTFTSAQAGLSGDVDLQIPKSIHRIKRPGAGTRYVHGGATLQEIVVPVISVNKKRQSDVTQVAVDIMPDSDKITTGQLPVRLLQRDPVTDKVQARTVRLGLFVEDTLISDQPAFTFDSTSDDQRARYQECVLYLNRDADQFNNVSVELRLEERVPNTDHWKKYAAAPYTLRRSFTADFDF